VNEPLPDWSLTEIDLTKPSAARIYDYCLGGAHNYGADRELARKILQQVPDGPLIAQANRAFLHRAVRYLVRQGIRQFIDIGSGIPTEGAVHETAQREAPDARVLYVDRDPLASGRTQLIIGSDPHVRVLRADLRRPADILGSRQCRELIDLDRPVAVLMVAVLHFVAEDDAPAALVEQFRDAIAPGSYLVISHSSSDARPEEGQRVSALYRGADDQLVPRSRARIGELLTGWDLVEPGLVWLSEWHPDWPDQVGDDPSATAFAAAVGRKPCT
jgi:hypothetical protein